MVEVLRIFCCVKNCDCLKTLYRLTANHLVYSLLLMLGGASVSITHHKVATQTQNQVFEFLDNSSPIVKRRKQFVKDQSNLTSYKQIANNQTKTTFQTMTFKDDGPKTDQNLPIDSTSSKSVKDSMNSRDAQDLASRMIQVDTISWSTDNDPKFVSTGKNTADFPSILFDQQLSNNTEQKPLLNVLRKWRYMKSDMTIRYSFNTNPYTQGKFICYFLPYGTDEEVENMSITRALMLRHCICDANSDRKWFEFSIPYQSSWGAWDLVEGTGHMGKFGMIQLNPIRNAQNVSVTGKCQISFSNVELSYNNPTGIIQAPTNESIPFNATQALGDMDEFPMLYQNFPSKGYTEIGAKLPVVTLDIAPNQVGSSSTAGFDCKYFNDSLNEMAKEYSYLGSFNWSTDDLDYEQPIMVIPVNPAAMRTEWSPNGTTSPPIQARTVTPTKLNYATCQGNYWKGGIKYKFEFCKTEFHSGRLRFTYVPFSTNGQTQILDSTNSSFSSTLNQTMGIDKGSFSYDLMPNVQSRIFDIKECEALEIDVPYNTTYTRLSTRPTDLSGTFLYPPFNSNAINLASDPAKANLQIPCMLGMIYVYMENPLVTSELCSQSINVNVYHCGDSDFEISYWNNEKLSNVNSNSVNSNVISTATVPLSGLVQDPAMSHVSEEPEEEENVMTMNQADDSTGMPGIPPISDLIRRPGFANAGEASSTGKKFFQLDPTNFGDNTNSKIPINYYSSLFRLWQGARKYLFSLPQNPVSSSTVNNNVSITQYLTEIETYIENQNNEENEYHEVYKMGTDTDMIDLGTFTDMVNNDIYRSTTAYDIVRPMMEEIISAFSSPIIAEYCLRVLDKFLGENNSDTIYAGSDGNLINGPGSPMYHEYKLKNFLYDPEDDTAPGYDNIDQNGQTLVSHELLMPFDHHIHSPLKKDGQYYDVKRSIPGAAPSNLDETFLYSPTSQLSENEFVGHKYRDGNHVTGIFWVITGLDPYTATYSITKFQPTNDSNSDDSTISGADLKQRLLTGQYEAFTGAPGPTGNISDIFSTPIERDLEFGIIKSFDVDTETYTFDIYEDVNSSVVKRTESKIYSVFASEVGDSITNFTGVLKTDIFPEDGRIKWTGTGKYYSDKYKKEYRLPDTAAMYITGEFGVTHEHDGFFPHTHNEDGTISCFGLTFGKTDGLNPGILDLFNYLKDAYSWMYENDDLVGYSTNVRSYIHYFLGKTQGDSPFHDHNFKNDFFEWYFRDADLFSREYMNANTTAKLEAFLEGDFVERAKAANFRQNMLDWFNIFEPYDLYKFRTSAPTPSNHTVYGKKAKHTHDFLTVETLGYRLQQGPNEPLWRLVAPLRAFKQTLNVSCTYSYKEFNKVAAFVASAMTNITDSTGLAERLPTHGDQTVEGVIATGTATAVAVSIAINVVSRVFNFFWRLVKKKNIKGGGENRPGGGTTVEIDYAKIKTAVVDAIEQVFPGYFSNLADSIGENFDEFATKLFDNIDTIVQEYPVYPTSVFSPTAIFYRDIVPIESRNEVPTLGGEYAVGPLPVRENMSAFLSPILVEGSTLPIEPSPSEVSSAYTIDISKGISYPTTRLSPTLNNFLTIELPYISNVNSQLVNRQGDKIIKGSSRAIAFVGLQSASLVIPNDAYVVSTRGELKGPLDAEARVLVPTYGYEKDNGIPYSLRLARSTNNNTNVGLARYSPFAGNGFKFGEFIGVPPMTIRLYNSWLSTHKPLMLY